jgi:hypothetical protein
METGIIKTMEGWHESRLDLGKYLQVGDVVSEDMANYFIEVLPPATFRETMIQIGEPNDHIRGRATFATIYKKSGDWVWAGFCYRGEFNEPGVRLTCCCCGEFAGHWKQWHNRDTGFGICKPCHERISQHKPFGHDAPTPEEMISLYGVEGVNWGAQ